MCSVDVAGGVKDWVISRETLMNVYPLMSKNYEVGGKFTFPANRKTGEIKRKTSHKKIHTINGENDSVQAPLGILNFHTHPISCYLQEDTVWGWASGEDIRESLLFGLRGSFAHAIPAVEGIYILQTNPCVLTSLANFQGSLELLSSKAGEELIDIYVDDIKKMHSGSHDFSNYLREKKLTGNEAKRKLLDLIEQNDEATLVDITSDIIRGIIVALIEIYFRSSHGFRTYKVNMRKKITPYDFIKFVESFQLGNIFNHKKKVAGCGNNIKCNGIPVYSKGTIRNTPFHKYLKEYEYDTGFYAVDKHGHTLSLNVPLRDIYSLLPLIEKIANKYIKCNKWFHLSMTPNNILIPNAQLVPYLSISTDMKKKILQYYHKNYESYLANNILPIVPQRDAAFHYFSIKGNCSYKDIQKHIQTNRFGAHHPKRTLKLHMIGSEKCPYTVKAENLLKSKKVLFTKEYYPTIAEALQHSGTSTIPAIYNHEEHIGGYDAVKSLV